MLFVGPAAILVLLFFVIPLGVLIWISFQDRSLLGSSTFTGLDSYREIPDNDRFVGAITFTLLYTLLATMILAVTAVVLVTIASQQRRGTKFYRTSFFLPYVVGTAAAGLIWYANIDDQTGTVTILLEKLGITDGPWGFLATPEKAIFTSLTLVAWKFVGLSVIVLIIGLQSIPTELYEAAHSDGATALQTLRYITLPLLRPTIALLVILSVTGSLLAFDHFFVLTGGGPDNSTITLVMVIYNTAFINFSLGKAAALSVVLLIALVALNGIQLFLLRTDDDR